ncbi:unnamed protein product [Ilex paraguariensis]|uniref:Uncharacterized protein n=1 Tax=Ilex paraguariensis TaxID=185542 RepID=A0ABC8TZ67_9AQUA
MSIEEGDVQSSIGIHGNRVIGTEVGNHEVTSTMEIKRGGVKDGAPWALPDKATQVEIGDGAMGSAKRRKLGSPLAEEEEGEKQGGGSWAWPVRDGVSAPTIGHGLSAWELVGSSSWDEPSVGFVDAGHRPS